MPLDFPTNPAVGTYYNGYIWDGTVWDSALQPSVPALLTTAPVYANEAARTTAVPSPAEGQLSYLNDINQFQGYAGSSWRGLGGLVPIVAPTVSVSGGTATANTLGVISFSGATSVSLNNVFSSSYTNYEVLIYGVYGSVDNAGWSFRYRASGTDNSSAQYYMAGSAYQNSNGGVSSWGTGVGSSYDLGRVRPGGAINASERFTIFNPAVSGRQTQIYGGGFWENSSSPYGFTMAGSVNNTAAYDGFTLFPGSGNFTGFIQVLGYNS